MGAKYGSVAVRFEKIFEGRVIFLAWWRGVFAGGFAISTGFLDGFLWLGWGGFAVRLWFLEDGFCGAKNMPQF